MFHLGKGRRLFEISQRVVRSALLLQRHCKTEVQVSMLGFVVASRGIALFPLARFIIFGAAHFKKP